MNDETTDPVQPIRIGEATIAADGCAAEYKNETYLFTARQQCEVIKMLAAAAASGLPYLAERTIKERLKLRRGVDRVFGTHKAMGTLIMKLGTVYTLRPATKEHQKDNEKTMGAMNPPARVYYAAER